MEAGSRPDKDDGLDDARRGRCPFDVFVFITISIRNAPHVMIFVYVGGHSESGTPVKLLLNLGVLGQHMTDHPQSERRIQSELKDVSLLSGKIAKPPRRSSSRAGVKPQPSWGRARYALIRTVDLEDQAVRASC